MPELPEAETIARGLDARVRGREILDVEILRQDVIDGPVDPFRGSIEGTHVSAVGRRGKNVVLSLTAHPARDGHTRLVVNLGMSGRLLLESDSSGNALATHPAVRFHLTESQVLVYHDIRRFGRLRAMDSVGYRDWSNRLGPEPLSEEFTEVILARALERSGAPIRSWLLDQSRVAGVGNIYANEALWHAGVHPWQAARDLAVPSVGRLHASLRTVLAVAIQEGGTTLRDYRTADGSQGSYAARLRVYGREGLPCPACQRAVVREVLGGRSAFFCPHCQPAPGA